MPDQDAVVRARRREVARRHHPDLGGDVETYVRAMAELDGDSPGAPGAPATAGGVVVAVRRRRPLRSAARRGRRLSRELRRRLPRRVPGARRYATLTTDQT